MTMVVGGIAAMTAASMADVYEISRLGIVFPAASVAIVRSIMMRVTRTVEPVAILSRVKPRGSVVMTR